jgi:hypothetical protein
MQRMCGFVLKLLVQHEAALFAGAKICCRLNPL